MKVKDYYGNTLKMKCSGWQDEPSTVEYWKMAADLYEKITYMNNVDIIINPGDLEREVVLQVRPD